MPMQSKAQNAAMHSAAEGKSTIGIPPSVGRDFVAASKGQNVSKLVARKGPFTLKREKRKRPEEKEPKAVDRSEGPAGERGEGE